MRTNFLFVVVGLVAFTGSASADLVNEFSGFSTVWEVGVSGLTSSYSADTISGLPVDGPTAGSGLAAFGPGRVSYPNGVGEVPSPGGAVGQHFDEGVLGVQVLGNSLVIRVADALDPRTGYYYDGWQTNYSQGDFFLSVEDGAAVRHFALLNTWARDTHGNPLGVNGGYSGAAQTFHVAGGVGGSSLEGHLVGLVNDADVALTGGTGSYNSSNAPAGLDLRAFAQNGLDLGNAGLTHTSVVDGGQTWYVQTWTVPVSAISSGQTVDVVLHAAPSCGNDQIGGRFMVPEPGSMFLVLCGFGLMYRYRRLG